MLEAGHLRGGQEEHECEEEEGQEGCHSHNYLNLNYKMRYTIRIY